MRITLASARSPDVRAAAAALAASAIADRAAGQESAGKVPSLAATAVVGPASATTHEPSTTADRRAGTAYPAPQSPGSFASGAAGNSDGTEKIAAESRVGIRSRRTQESYHGRATGTVAPVLQVSTKTP